MEKVKNYFISRGASDVLVPRIQQFPQSSATVEEAAACLHCYPAHVAKSLCFLQKAKVGAGSGADNLVPVVVVTAGHAKSDNKKYKAAFGQPAKMVKKEDVEALVGFPPGGVCPFAVNDAVKVYLDVSLKQFKNVYPACGTIDSGMRVTVAELEEYATNFVEWVDICQGWQEYPPEGAADDNLADDNDASNAHSTRNIGSAFTEKAEEDDPHVDQNHNSAVDDPIEVDDGRHHSRRGSDILDESRTEDEDASRERGEAAEGGAKDDVEPSATGKGKKVITRPIPLYVGATTQHVAEEGPATAARHEGSPLGEVVVTRHRHGATYSSCSFGTADPSLDADFSMGEEEDKDAEKAEEEEQAPHTRDVESPLSAREAVQPGTAAVATTTTTTVGNSAPPQGFRARLPLVFVIAPRLVSSFIHHGAICSLELMSQQWELTAENVAMLIRSLYETLNPFEGDGRVVVAEEPAGSGQPSRNAYTEEEHRYGVAHIHKAHPHLFRGYMQQQQQQHEHSAQDDEPAGMSRGAAAAEQEEDKGSTTSEGGIDEYLLASSSCSSGSSSSSHNSLYYCGGHCGFSSDDDEDRDYPHVGDDAAAGPSTYIYGKLCPPPLSTSAPSYPFLPATSSTAVEGLGQEEACQGVKEGHSRSCGGGDPHASRKGLTCGRQRHICTHLHKKVRHCRGKTSKDEGEETLTNHIRLSVTTQEQLLFIANELVRYQKVGQKKKMRTTIMRQPQQQQQHEGSAHGSERLLKQHNKYFIKAKIRTDALVHEHDERWRRKREEGNHLVHESTTQSGDNENNSTKNSSSSNNNNNNSKFVQPIVSATTQKRQLLYEIVLPSFTDAEHDNDRGGGQQRGLSASSSRNSIHATNHNGDTTPLPAAHPQRHYTIHISGDALVTEGAQWHRDHAIHTTSTSATTTNTANLSRHHHVPSLKKRNGDRVALFFRNEDTSEIISSSTSSRPSAHGSRMANNIDHVMALMLDDGEEIPTTSIPANMTLCLSHVYVYGHLQVFGNLILKDCVFVGTLSAEQGANVRILRSEVAIHVEDQLMLPAASRAEADEGVGGIGVEEDAEGGGGRGQPLGSDDGDDDNISRSDKGSSSRKRCSHRKRRKIKISRREGVLVLDTSRLEILDNTLVYRIRYDDSQQQTISPFTQTRQHAMCANESISSGVGSDRESPKRLQVPEPPPSVLRRVMRSIILVSNQARLRVVQSRIDPWVGSERTIFAEQGAIVDASQSTFLAGISSAVGIQGCRAFFERCLFVGVPSGPAQLLVQDTLRATGLNAELGGLLTVRHCTAQHVYFGFSVIAHSVGHFYDCHSEDTVNGFTVDASTAHLENCSARAHHVGVFTLRQAKCVVTDDRGGCFAARCQALAVAATRAEQMVEDHFMYYHRDATDPASASTSSSSSSSSSSSTSVEDEETARRWSAHGADGGKGEAQEGEDKKAHSALQRLAAHNSNPYRADLRHALRHIRSQGAPARREGQEALLRMVMCSLFCVSLSRHGPTEEVVRMGDSLSGAAEPLPHACSSCGWPVIGSGAYHFVAAMDAPHFSLSGAVAAAAPSVSGRKDKQRQQHHYDPPLLSRETSGNNYYYHDQRRGQQPCAFFGGRFGLEVNNAQLKARGVTLLQAQDAPVYVYDGSQVELEEMLVLNAKRDTTQTQGCGVKVVRAQLRVHCCLVVDYVFAFAALQGATVTFEECMALRGVNGFTVDGSTCHMVYCGADTNHVGVYALNRSQVKMEGTPHLVGVTSTLRIPPRLICGGFPSVLRGGLYGVEAQSCHMTCIGITVLRGSDTGFNAYTGSQLHLDRCLVDLSPEDAAVYVFKIQPHSGTLPSLRPHQIYESTMGLMAPLLLRDTDAPFRAATAASGATGSNSGSKNNNNNNSHPSSNNSPAEPLHSTSKHTTPYSPGQHSAAEAASKSNNSNSGGHTNLKSSGVKVWSSSHCVAQHCEVRCTAFGFAAIGPEAVLEASHCTAKRTANGFTVDSATMELSKCSAKSSYVGICVVSHGQCVVQRGSYTARRHAIEVKGGVLHVQEHVKLYGFSHSGLYAHDGAHLESDIDSVLDIKCIREGGGGAGTALENQAEPQLPRGTVAPPLGPYLASCEPAALLPVCLLLERATARVSQAVLGGGARCAVHCLPGAQLYLRNAHLHNFTLLGIRVARQAQLIGCNCGLHATTPTTMGFQTDASSDRAELGRLALVVQAGGMCRLSLGADFNEELPPLPSITAAPRRERRAASDYDFAEEQTRGEEADQASTCPSASDDNARAKLVLELMLQSNYRRTKAWWHPTNFFTFPFGPTRDTASSSNCTTPAAERTYGGPFTARDFVALGHTYISAAYTPFRLQLHHHEPSVAGHGHGTSCCSNPQRSAATTAPQPFQVALVGRCHVEGTAVVERIMIIQQQQQRQPHASSSPLGCMHVCNGGVLSVSQCLVQWVEPSAPGGAAAAAREGEALFTCEGKESRLRLRNTFFSPSPAVHDDDDSATNAAATTTTIVARHGGRVRLHCISSTALSDWPFFAPAPVSEARRADTGPQVQLRLTLEVGSGAVARCDACAFHRIVATENGNVNLYRCQLYAAPGGGGNSLLSLREGAHACLSHSKLFTSLLCDPHLAISVATLSTLTMQHTHFIGWQAPFVAVASRSIVIVDSSSAGTLLLEEGCQTGEGDAEGEEEEETRKGAFLVCEDDSSAVYLDAPYMPTYRRLQESMKQMVQLPSLATQRTPTSPQDEEPSSDAPARHHAIARRPQKQESTAAATRVPLLTRVLALPSLPPLQKKQAETKFCATTTPLVEEEEKEETGDDAACVVTCALRPVATLPAAFMRACSIPVAPASTRQRCDSLWWVEKEFEAEEGEDEEEEGMHAGGGGVFVSRGRLTSGTVSTWLKEQVVASFQKLFQSFF